jgi:enoyl-CoA hydratase/carnithine racemase
MPAVLYELDGHVATITYNRPEVQNRINGEFRTDVNAAWQRFLDEQDAWIAIVTGAGDAFCAGADFSSGGGAGTWPGTYWEIPTINSFESGWEVWKPTIAAVNGICQGYGLTGVLAMDFVIASDRASFGFGEVTRGIATVVGALRLPTKVGWQRAMEMVLTGEMFSAEHAKEIGLASWVVPHDQLMEEAHKLANRLLQGAPLAQRAVKEIAHRGQKLPWADAVRAGETMRRMVGQTEDAKEGMAAYREGRKPNFQGR